MDTSTNSTLHHLEAAGTRSLVNQGGRFLLHLLEMLLAMAAGMAVFHLLEKLVPEGSALTVVTVRDSLLHTVLMDAFMTVGMVSWMLYRGHGRRHSLEMAVAMLSPIAAVNLLCELGLEAYLPGLANASGPAMVLGMLAAMVYRRGHYTGHGDHLIHSANHSRPGVTGLVKRYPLASFFGLAYLISFIWGMVYYMMLPDRQPIAGIVNLPMPLMTFLLLGAVSSSASGIILAWMVEGKAGIREMLRRAKVWRVGIRWYVAAAFTNSIVVLAALLGLSGVVSPAFRPEVMIGQNVALMIPIGLFIGLMAGILEEWGWVGFALPRLLSRYSAFTAALLLGIVWSLWHAMMVFWLLPVSPKTGTVLDFLSGLVFLAALVPYRILMTWVYVNSKASLLITILMHACFDASLAVFTARGLSLLEYVQFYGALTASLWVAVGLVVMIFGKQMAAGASKRSEH